MAPGEDERARGEATDERAQGEATTGAGTKDPLVEAAAAHWGPRFVHNGTEQADFDETLARIERWADWCKEWGRSAMRYEEVAARAEEARHPETASDAWRRAGLCWHWAKFVFVDDPVQQRAAHDRAVACYARGAHALRPPARRVTVPYRGSTLAAYLRVPATADGAPPPVVLMVPGLDSVKEELQATAEYFVARGLAALAIDGPGQGEGEIEHRIEPAYEAVTSAALDACEDIAQIDAGRVGIFGVSLGGYYAARSMAFEPRIRAGVVLAGPYRFDADWDTLPQLTRAAFRHRSGATDDAEARERAGALSLEGVAARITQPLLVLHGAQDRIVPLAQGERLAAEAPGSVLRVYDDGNHGVTNHAWASRSELADWLFDQLGSPHDAA